MMKKEKSSILIVHYSGIELTINCIRSLITCKNKTDFEVVLINNSSVAIDDEIHLAFDRASNIHILDNPSKNKGFSSGIYYGSKNVKNEYVVILDNDTLVFDYWLDELIEPFYQYENIGITTSCIEDAEEDRPNILGGKINILGFSYPNKVKDINNYEDNEKLFYGITAWCISRKILLKIGVDTEFLFFADDADIGFKVKSLGYEVVAALKSKVKHLKREKDYTTNFKNYHKIGILNRDYLIFTFKNLSYIHFLFFFIFFVFMKLIFIPPRIVIKKDYSFLHDFIGIQKFLETKNLIKRRHENQKIKNVPYMELFSQYSKRLYVGTMIFN